MEVFEASVPDFEVVFDDACEEDVLSLLLLLLLLPQAARDVDNSVIITIAEILFNIFLSSFEYVSECLYFLSVIWSIDP